MKLISIVLVLLVLHLSGYCQKKESRYFFQETQRIDKGIKHIILNVADEIADSCENAVLYFIFIQDAKKTKFKVAGDDSNITSKIKIDPGDSVMVNWSAIDGKIQNQMLIQPVVLKCQGKEHKDIFLSVNNFNAILSSSQENRKNKITLLDPMIVDVGLTVH